MATRAGHGEPGAVGQRADQPVDPLVRGEPPDEQHAVARAVRVGSETLLIRPAVDHPGPVGRNAEHLRGEPRHGQEAVEQGRQQAEPAAPAEPVVGGDERAGPAGAPRRPPPGWARSACGGCARRRRRRAPRAAAGRADAPGARARDPIGRSVRIAQPGAVADDAGRGTRRSPARRRRGGPARGPTRPDSALRRPAVRRRRRAWGRRGRSALADGLADHARRPRHAHRRLPLPPADRRARSPVRRARPVRLGALRAVPAAGRRRAVGAAAGGAATPRRGAARQHRGRLRGAVAARPAAAHARGRDPAPAARGDRPPARPGGGAGAPRPVGLPPGRPAAGGQRGARRRPGRGRAAAGPADRRPARP